MTTFAWLSLVLGVASVSACASASSSAEPQDSPPAQADAPIDTPVPDGTTCTTQPCDIQPQCGCSATQACDIDFSDFMGTACRNKADTGVEGTACTGSAPQVKCAASYVCLGTGQERQCGRYCTSDTDCLSPRGQCVFELNSGGAPIAPGATACSSNCDPAAATNPLCPANWTCDLFTATFMGNSKQIADCRIAGTAGQGATCSSTVRCAAGFTCVTQGAMMKCAKLCKPPANTGCPGSTTCLGFTTAFTVGGTEYGACL